MVEPRSAIREILAESLEEIESGRATAEACLAEYPAYAAELRPLLLAARVLGEAAHTKPSPVFRREARARLMARIQPESPKKPSLLGALRQKLRPSTARAQGRRLSLAWILLLVLLTVVSVNAGTVYASDAAVPGQALYSLDRTIERLRATLTRDPEAAAELQLDFADERLSEARLLIEEEDTVHFNEALAGYGDAISTAADAVESAGATAGDGLALLLEESMAGQDTQLAGLFVPIGDEALDGDAAANRFCSEGEAHPVAQSIAERYGTDVGQIMDWFCGSGEAPGIGFGQIMLALRGQAALGSGGPSAEELLERRANGEGWGQIWKDLGVAGKPAGVGPPEHAGPKDKARGPEEAGPPDRAGPKNGN